MPVHDHNATMVRRKTQHQLGCNLVVPREYRPGKTPAPTACELDRARDVLVRHYRTNRTKRLDGMNRVRSTRITAEEQRRRHKGAPLRVRTNNLELARVTIHQLGLLPELGKLIQHLATLARGGHRPHTNILQSRIADRNLTERLAQRVDNILCTR